MRSTWPSGQQRYQCQNAVDDCTIKIAPDGCVSVHYVVTNFRPFLTLIHLIRMEEWVGIRHDVRCHTARKSRASAMGRQVGGGAAHSRCILWKTAVEKSEPDDCSNRNDGTLW